MMTKERGIVRSITFVFGIDWLTYKTAGNVQRIKQMIPLYVRGYNLQKTHSPRARTKRMANGSVLLYSSP